VRVGELQRGAGLDDEEAAAPEHVFLGLVTFAHVDRQRPVQDDEQLLLDRVDVAPSHGARADAGRGSRGPWS
jgi:hypothetical protein